MTPEEKANQLFTAAGYTEDYWARRMAEEAAMVIKQLATRMTALSDVHYYATKHRPFHVQGMVPPIIAAMVVDIKEMLEANEYGDAKHYWDKVESYAVDIEITE